LFGQLSNHHLLNNDFAPWSYYYAEALSKVQCPRKVYLSNIQTDILLLWQRAVKECLKASCEACFPLYVSVPVVRIARTEN